MNNKKFAAIILVVTALVTQTAIIDGAKILAVYTFLGKSHYMMHRALINELLKNGHEITMITAITLEPQKMGKNYTELLIEPEFDHWKYTQEKAGIKSQQDFTNDLSKQSQLRDSFIISTEHALKQPKVQAIINAKQTKGVYDLLMMEEMYQNAFQALAYVYDVPVLSTTTFSQRNLIQEMFGVILPWSYVPLTYLPFTDRMSFWQRVQNTYRSLEFDLHRHFHFFPKMDELVQKYFGHLGIDFPSTSAMSKNVSIMLINNHPPLAFPAPVMSNMINVAGMHIYPSKPLPTDIQTFLDGAEHGAIYFSLGTVVQWKDVPSETLNIFLDVFRTMKQRVLWKFENDSLPNSPSNVMVKKWLPQNDILAHPNVRTFIAHGGLFGIQEAIYHGVPIIGIPFIFDQVTNLMKCESGGYAITLDIHKLTRENLKNALHKILYTPKYRETMKRMSQIFRDRPMGPRETAMYWVDYVIRHKGASHLRAAGLDLKWYQFYLLDVVAFFVGTAALVLGVVFVITRWIWRRFRGEVPKQKVH